MENSHLPQIEITNKNVPESLKAQILKVQNRIIEVENIVNWMRAYPGERDSTLPVLRKLNKIIEKARCGIRLIKDDYPEAFHKDNESAFMMELKSYCIKLWDIRITFELYDQR